MSSSPKASSEDPLERGRRLLEEHPDFEEGDLLAEHEGQSLVVPLGPTPPDPAAPRA